MYDNIKNKLIDYFNLEFSKCIKDICINNLVYNCNNFSQSKAKNLVEDVSKQSGCCITIDEKDNSLIATLYILYKDGYKIYIEFCFDKRQFIAYISDEYDRVVDKLSFSSCSYNSFVTNLEKSILERYNVSIPKFPRIINPEKGEIDLACKFVNTIENNSRYFKIKSNTTEDIKSLLFEDDGIHVISNDNKVHIYLKANTENADRYLKYEFLAEIDNNLLTLNKAIFTGLDLNIAINTTKLLLSNHQEFVNLADELQNV